MRLIERNSGYNLRWLPKQPKQMKVGAARDRRTIGSDVAAHVKGRRCSACLRQVGPGRPWRGIGRGRGAARRALRARRCGPPLRAGGGSRRHRHGSRQATPCGRENRLRRAWPRPAARSRGTPAAGRLAAVRGASRCRALREAVHRTTPWEKCSGNPAAVSAHLVRI